MLAKVSLKIVKGKIKEKDYIFDSRTSCIIGRHSECNLRIPTDKNHATISRYHCLLDINPPDIRIRDLGSRHGTHINGKLIGKRKKGQTPEEGSKLNLPEYDLKDGDKITIGKTTFKVCIQVDSKVATTYIMPGGNNLPAKVETTVLINDDRNKTKLWDFIISLFQRAEGGEETLGAIKGYSLLRKIGEGGFGEVYLSRHNATKELVALKVMLPQVAAQPYMVKKFLREIETTKVLNHPNLIQLKDCCTSDGLFFLTLEYCNKGTVKSLMQQRGGKLSIEEALSITFQVLDGLDYAHTKENLIHRDIKPDNIFLTEFSRQQNFSKTRRLRAGKKF